MVRFFLSVLSVLGFSFSKVGQSTTLKQTGFNFQQSLATWCPVFMPMSMWLDKYSWMSIITIIFMRHFEPVTSCYFRKFLLGSFHALDIAPGSCRGITLFSMCLNNVLDNSYTLWTCGVTTAPGTALSQNTLMSPDVPQVPFIAFVTWNRVNLLTSDVASTP